MATQSIRRGGYSVVGFGHCGTLAAPAPEVEPVRSTPWMEVIASSVVGVATGWIIEEIVRKVRSKRR